MPMFPYTQEDLDGFRSVQRLAYDIATSVEGRLEVGMSESDVCELLQEAQRQAGVTQVFHQPFVWFGARTVLGPSWTPDIATAAELVGAGADTIKEFFPTEHRLAEGMPLIVDLGPVVDGYASDIGYSCVVGANETYDELSGGLADIRRVLLDGVRAGRTLRSLYAETHELISDHGWEACHQHYPDRALGHLVFRLDPDPDRETLLAGFGTAAAERLLTAGLTAVAEGTCYPIWNDSPYTDFPASPGVWAVEPHIGRDGVGVKFEEIMVVTDDDAYWLDESLPHAVRWAQASPAVTS